MYDESKKDQWLEFRKSTDENFDEHYKGLPKLFYPRKFFEDFATKHDLQIKFTDSNLVGYHNRDFIYNVYLWKKSD